jgi:hypothetical protein
MSADELDRELARLAKLARSDGRPGAKERVRRALDGHVRRRAPAAWLRFAAAATLVCVAAVASAMFGRSWWRAHQEAAQHKMHRDGGPAAPLGAIKPAPPTPPEPEPMIIEPEVIERGDRSTPASPSSKASAPERKRTVPSVSHGPARVTAPMPVFAPSVAVAPTPPPPRDSGAFTVTLAMKVLRRDHDAQGALALLKEYLAIHPNGELAEEALALSVDAAAQFDDDEAVALAERYLGKYPHGRFAAQARAALSRFDRAR